MDHIKRRWKKREKQTCVRDFDANSGSINRFSYCCPICLFCHPPNRINVIMKDSIFNKIIWSIVIIGILVLLILSIITIVLYNQASIVTFIEKELW